MEMFKGLVIQKESWYTNCILEILGELKLPNSE